MLEVRTIVVGKLSTNCYVVYDRKSSKSIIIDPGDDAEVIVNAISDLEVRLLKIVATHGHYDHLLAVNELKIPLLMTKADKVMFSWYRKSAIAFSGNDPGPAPKIDKYLNYGDEISVGKNKLVVIESPGHTPGGISLYCKDSQLLFSGDTLFADGGVGRTDFAYADKHELDESLLRLLKLPPETTIYSGHGRETSIVEARSYFDEK